MAKLSCSRTNFALTMVSRVGNGTRWDEIYQSQSRPVYASGMKKYLIHVPIFIFGTKICLNSVLKIAIPSGHRVLVKISKSIPNL